MQVRPPLLLSRPQLRNARFAQRRIRFWQDTAHVADERVGRPHSVCSHQSLDETFNIPHGRASRG